MTRPRKIAYLVFAIIFFSEFAFWVTSHNYGVWWNVHAIVAVIAALGSIIALGCVLEDIE